MKALKRFNREQITLGAAAVLSVLLFGWQMTRAGAETTAGTLPRNDRVYGIGRKSQIEFVDPKLILKGRNPWEPPAAGRLPIPEIRPPEPKLGQMMLPPFAPLVEDAEFNRVYLPGKTRSISAVVKTAAPQGFPPDEEIAALKTLAEVEIGPVVDKRRQLMRPDGLALIHVLPAGKTITGKITLDSHQTDDQSIILNKQVEGGSVKIIVRPEEINRSGPDEGVERGWEYEKEYKRRADKLKPDDAEGHRKLAVWAREKAGMLPEARDSMAAAVDLLLKKSAFGPALEKAVLDLVDILRDLGAYDDAIATMQDYLEAIKGTSNETAALHLRLGRLYAELGYHERSLISYDAAFGLEPGRAPPQIALARARLSLGETRMAMDHIDALLIGGGTPEPEALTVQGLARLRRGMAEQAEESFTNALKGKPNDAEALNGLGIAMALQRKPEAASKFLAAIKADQYRIEAWINLAMLYLENGRPTEAEILFAGAAQRDPDSSTAVAGPGFVAVLNGRWTEAGQAFDRARKTKPDDYFMSYALARLQLREGRAKDALELFRSALKINPEYLPATTDAALAYLMLARDEALLASRAPADKQAPLRERAETQRASAQTLLETSFRADPNSQAANAALGCVYAVRGMVREANSAFDRAVRSGVPDPLIDYGRGYVEYWYGAGSPKDRLDLAEVKFRFGESHVGLTDPADLEWKAECAKAIKSIEDWRTQRIFIADQFEGGPSLTNQWVPVNPNQEPQVRFANNQAVIGDSAGNSPSRNFAALEHREISKDGFLSAEWTFNYESGTGFETGFSLYTSAIGAAGSAAGLHFVFVEDTNAPGKPIKVYYAQMTAVRDQGPQRPPTVLGTLPGGPGRQRFKLERFNHPTEQRTWSFNLHVYDEAKGAWRQLNDAKLPIKLLQGPAIAPTWFMQLWGRSLGANRKWSVGIDDVTVLTVEAP